MLQLVNKVLEKAFKLRAQLGQGSCHHYAVILCVYQHTAVQRPASDADMWLPQQGHSKEQREVSAAAPPPVPILAELVRKSFPQKFEAAVKQLQSG